MAVSTHLKYEFRLTNELLGQLTLRQVEHPFQTNPVSPAQFGELIDLVTSKRITGVYDNSFDATKYTNQDDNRSRR